MDMVLVKNLFFNLSLILLLLFIFNLWTERYNIGPVPRILRIVGLSLSVLVCLFFSIPAYGIMLDLRQVPIIIGGLYYGYGPFLTVLALLLRGLFYGFDTGFWTIFPLYSILALFLWRAHPWFLRQTSNQRFMVSLLTIVVMSACTFAGLLLTGLSIYELKTALFTTLIQFVATAMLCYLLEEMRQNEFLREQMVKAQKIELASHMTAAISHEIRNPLTAVRGFLQLARENPVINGPTKGYIDTALSELSAAERVITDYLTFAQPYMHTHEKFYPGNELNQIVTSLQPLANMNSVEMEMLNHEQYIMLGDKSRFKQCFLNIMKNCIEAMPNGGRLTIHIGATNDGINISVRDTGTGMSKEQIKRLGEPYYSTKGTKGTGLGLMVSFSIIRELKGFIKITSEPGEGSEFIVTFPVFSEMKSESSKERVIPSK
ncbi:ATP-binding protein [Peribacillus sp. SCS-155]|uniref:ATP-binding protein n=1 Tax=Peribacillus sedimenti TaxID=3115297 RepID=UPI0039057B49